MPFQASAVVAGGCVRGTCSVEADGSACAPSESTAQTRKTTGRQRLMVRSTREPGGGSGFMKAGDGEGQFTSHAARARAFRSSFGLGLAVVNRSSPARFGSGADCRSHC